MVAVINSGKSIRKTFFYNDNKLQKGTAELLMAENYPMDLEYMTSHMRLNMLIKTAAKGENVERPSLHISLNFAPMEQFTSDRLKQITSEYMDLIGLGQQPYLMYRHYDAAHPHVHIVTHRIGPIGKAIDTFNIGKLKSKPATIYLENRHGLVKVADHKRALFKMTPVQVSKVIYNKSLTKKAIEDVVNFVLRKYKFSSLSTFNAILNGYNVYASRGTKDSRIYKKNGLVYRLIGPDGQMVGKGIPASDLNESPTLNTLQTHYKNKKEYTESEKARVKNEIELCFKKQPNLSLIRLMKALQKQNIQMVVFQNSDSRIYGISYVDRINRVVFNGSDLDKAYSANAIVSRCSSPVKPPQMAIENLNSDHPKRLSAPKTKVIEQHPVLWLPRVVGEPETAEEEKTLLEILLNPDYSDEPVPYPLRANRKKKKKKKNR